MDSAAFREAFRESYGAVLSLLAIIVGFVLLRVAAINESYVIMVAAFGLMVGGLVALTMRDRRTRNPEWNEAQ